MDTDTLLALRRGAQQGRSLVRITAVVLLVSGAAYLLWPRGIRVLGISDRSAYQLPPLLGIGTFFSYLVISNLRSGVAPFARAKRIERAKQPIAFAAHTAYMMLMAFVGFGAAVLVYLSGRT